MHRFALLLLLLVALAQAGCSADGPTRSTNDAAATSGPTVYGRVHVSVDHVEVSH